MADASSPLASDDLNRIAYRKFAVIALYGLFAFWGAAQLVAPDNSLLYIASAIAFATSATFWFATDRRILAKPRLPILHLLFFFTWPIASLIHLLTSRGFRGIGYWMMHAIGLFATMCLTFFPAMFLLYWLGILEMDAAAGP